MHTIEIKEEALPIVKSGISFEKKRLEYSYQKYSHTVEIFEKKYQKSSSQFLKEFNSGALGDDEKWFDWLFALKAQTHLKKKLNLLDSIEL